MRPRTHHQSLFKRIGANVRAVRMEKGITQERLAEDADLDVRFLQRVERGTTNYTVDVLATLAKAVGVDPAAFFRPVTIEPARPGRPKSAATKKR